MDWLKVQKHTWRKAEIRQVARVLGVGLADAFLAWFRLWSALDELSADGSIPYYTEDDADSDAGLPGAGRAFAAVGWLLFDRHGCTAVHFDRHNGASAKARSLKAERQRRWRSGDVDATPSTDVDAGPSTRPSTREEKRREEKKGSHQVDD